MPPFAAGGSAQAFKPKNKERRKAAYVKHKKAKDGARRDMRMRRRRAEDNDPAARAARLARNVPATIDRKRVWDEIAGDAAAGDGLGLSVDIAALKRQRLDHEALPGGGMDDLRQGLTEGKLKKAEEEMQDAAAGEAESDAADEDGVELNEDQDEQEPEEDDLASIMNDSEEDGDQTTRARKPSPPASTASTALTLIPDALAAKFPQLFSKQAPKDPKILITTSLGGSNIHHEAEQLTTLFPNSAYVPRQRHRYKSHHFSLREISRFASNRDFTTLLVLEEDQKRPSGLTAICLPSGPTLSFSVKNWVRGAELPGHGRPTDHHPELVLNGFRTPLGLLVAHFFRTLFPATPELEGRQVLTLHNARDYIFVRRHRYQFRDKRATEKSATEADGKLMAGVEQVRAGLQELGPRFTLKLRRVDKGIQRASGLEWEWKARMEKTRTKFQL